MHITPWLLVRRLSAKLVPTFADRGCHVVSAPDPYGRYYRFSRPEPLLFHSISSSIILTRLSSRPTTLRKSGSARNRTRDLWICSQELWPLDHRGGLSCTYIIYLIYSWFQFSDYISQLVKMKYTLHQLSIWEELIKNLENETNISKPVTCLANWW
jgi:hypothetical protein